MIDSSNQTSVTREGIDQVVKATMHRFGGHDILIQT
jgi:hypothetical protein